MKARRVKRLDVDAPLADAMERTVRVRLDELCSFGDAVRDGDAEALHDMRIAAKRLRYLLEFSSFCFGAYARTATKRVKAVQDLLGDIHDCDVLEPRVLAELAALREEDALALVGRAALAEDLAPALAGRAGHRTAYRGLEVLATWAQARRRLLVGRFAGMWSDLDREGFRPRLEAALAERPADPDSVANGAQAVA